MFGISLRDPLTLGASAALLTMVALLACYLPARPAAQYLLSTTLSLRSDGSGRVAQVIGFEDIVLIV